MNPKYNGAVKQHTYMYLLTLYSILSSAKYFLAVFILLAFSAAATVAVLNLHHSADICGRPPLVVRKVVLCWLAKVVFMGDLMSDGEENKVRRM